MVLLLFHIHPLQVEVGPVLRLVLVVHGLVFDLDAALFLSLLPPALPRPAPRPLAPLPVPGPRPPPAAPVPAPASPVSAPAPLSIPGPRPPPTVVAATPGVVSSGVPSVLMVGTSAGATKTTP